MGGLFWRSRTSPPELEPVAEDTLEARQVTVAFDGLVALAEVDLVLHPGEILGLIGPNGAGKTTLVNAISGFVRPKNGRIYVEAADVTDWEPHSRARKGLGRSFQGVRLFKELTVLENIEAGVLTRGFGRREASRRAQALLGQMGFKLRAELRAGALPAGDQHLVGVLRALALNPKFLLLDEPAAGLNEAESAELVTSIRSIRDEFGCAVLVIDHDMRVIMPLCERIQVLNYGRTICVGAPAIVRSEPAVIEAYLGSQGEQQDA